jgi:hypothetical protein
MSIVPPTAPDQPCWSLPHHAVQQQTPRGTKFRVVFDATRSNTVGCSLNASLLPGPSLLGDLSLLLLRWRNYRYVFTQMTKIFSVFSGIRESPGPQSITDFKQSRMAQRLHPSWPSELFESWHPLNVIIYSSVLPVSMKTHLVRRRYVSRSAPSSRKTYRTPCNSS